MQQTVEEQVAERDRQDAEAMAAVARYDARVKANAESEFAKLARIERLELLNDVRTYRNWIGGAFEATDQRIKQRQWTEAHSMATRLIAKYGPATFARIDDAVYRCI